jgi:transposase
MLRQAFYSIRSERLLMERLDFELLYRWFVGLGIDDCVWNFLAAVLAQQRVKRLLTTTISRSMVR